MSGLELYTYFRSSAAYRVRIALNLKGVKHKYHTLNLLQNSGENNSPEYLKLNPQGLLPTLVDDEEVYTQSLAIIEYLDERYPLPPLLPFSIRDRARVRAISQIIACDIHPLNNLRVAEYLKQRLMHSEKEWIEWYHHWIHEGFEAVESLLLNIASRGNFCIGNTPTLADICLVSQVYNARRFQCELTQFPNIVRITEHCQKLDAFSRAAPENQPDSK